jgi:hypothetical protein
VYPAAIPPAAPATLGYRRATAWDDSSELSLSSTRATLTSHPTHVRSALGCETATRAPDALIGRPERPVVDRLADAAGVPLWLG